MLEVVRMGSWRAGDKLDKALFVRRGWFRGGYCAAWVSPLKPALVCPLPSLISEWAHKVIRAYPSACNDRSAPRPFLVPDI